MYHVETIDIGKKHLMFSYLDHACLCANNMYNVANFHIRNLMTGLHEERSDILRISQEYKRNPGQTGQRARVCPVSA